MKIILSLLFFVSISSFAQYEEYESYETFSELDQYQRDYGLIFVPSFIYTNIDEQNTVTGSTVSDRTRSLTYYDLKLGYIFRNGFYFGILYSGETQDVNTASPQTTRESVGMSFGYIYKGWSFTGSFFPYSKQELDNTIDVSRYSGGMGYQFDAAYYFRLNRYFSIGPQLVYKSFRYSEAVNATTSVSADASSQHSLFTPMVTIIFNIYRG